MSESMGDQAGRKVLGIVLPNDDATHFPSIKCSAHIQMGTDNGEEPWIIVCDETGKEVSRINTRHVMTIVWED